MDNVNIITVSWAAAQQAAGLAGMDPDAVYPDVFGYDNAWRFSATYRQMIKFTARLVAVYAQEISSASGQPGSDETDDWTDAVSWVDGLADRVLLVDSKPGAGVPWVWVVRDSVLLEDRVRVGS